MAIHSQCHILSITGGKGGVGKSVFAANFAQALVLELKARVLLIDLDAQSCGDQNVILGLRPNKIISEVATFSGQISATTLSTLITAHNSGVHFIGAVRGAGDQYEVRVDGLKRALESLSNLYNYIIIDVGTQMGNAQLFAMENSTCAIVLTQGEILTLNQTNKMMTQLTNMMFPNDMLLPVLNKMSPTSLTAQSAMQILKKNILGVIPQDDAIAAASLARSTPFVGSAPRSPVSMAYHEIARRLTQAGTLDKLRSLNRPKGIKASAETTNNDQVKILGGLSTMQARPNEVARPENFDLRNALKRRLHIGLIETLDLKKRITETNNDPEKEKELRLKTQQAIVSLLEKEATQLGRDDRGLIVKEVLDEALGLGPLEDLLADITVTEIMVNRRDLIFVEKNGRLTKTDLSFTSDQQLRTVIERIVTPLGRHIDTKSPYVDARLKDGSRVNAIIPPLSLDGPCLTIRKFAKTPITFKDYVKFDTMTDSMVDFLRICVENKLNVIISGGTGSGKTTLLNVLSGFIPSNERIITIEDAAELQLKQEHIVRLETRPANMEDTGAITIRDLVRNSLRMRPDRIIVGECRGGEALDMLSAMNTGHDGSLTTVHANSPREAISRLETLCMMAGMDLPARAIREQIAGAVDLIVQISRLSDGSRKVISVTEVQGMQGEVVTLQELYKYKEEGMDKNRKITGQFQALFVPKFLEEFRRRGVNIPSSLFGSQQAEAPKVAAVPKASGGGGK